MGFYQQKTTTLSNFRANRGNNVTNNFHAGNKRWGHAIAIFGNVVVNHNLWKLFLELLKLIPFCVCILAHWTRTFRNDTKTKSVSTLMNGISSELWVKNAGQKQSICKEAIDQKHHCHCHRHHHQHYQQQQQTAQNWPKEKSNTIPLKETPKIPTSHFQLCVNDSIGVMRNESRPDAPTRTHTRI